MGRVYPLAFEVGAHDGNLVHAVHIKVLDAQHLKAPLERSPVASRDDAHPVALTHGVGQCVAILGVVAAQKVTARQRHNRAVGHHAVDVEDEGFGEGYIFLEVSHMY